MLGTRKLVVILAHDEVPPGTMKRVSYPPYDVLVANVDGTLHAIEDACPHSGQSLERGTLVGAAVICAGHDWSICLRSGRVLVPVGCGQNPVFEVVECDDGVSVFETH